MAPECAATVASLMSGLRGGDPDAAARLVDLFYPDLKRLAAVQMAGERRNHTWQPTVLVNELYLELTRITALPTRSSSDRPERDAFLGLAVFIMKRLLAHHARPLPSRVKKADIDEASGLEALDEQALHEVEDLLRRLGAIDPRLRAVVEMKVFEGLSRKEIAKQLGCSVRTVARHWEFAQHWLQQRLAAPRVGMTNAASA
jgi:RNA polymerase sigma factor (TIGR02999 family)